MARKSTPIATAAGTVPAAVTAPADALSATDETTPASADAPAAPVDTTIADLAVVASARLDAATPPTDQPTPQRPAIDDADLPDDDGGINLHGRTIWVRSVSLTGRRRAGMAFGPVPSEVRVDALSEEQLLLILGDSEHLVIQLDQRDHVAD